MSVFTMVARRDGDAKIGGASSNAPAEPSSVHNGNGFPTQPVGRIESNARLFERIDALHRGRTSLWRRILRRLTWWR